MFVGVLVVCEMCEGTVEKFTVEGLLRERCCYVILDVKTNVCYVDDCQVA